MAILSGAAPAARCVFAASVSVREHLVAGGEPGVGRAALVAAASGARRPGLGGAGTGDDGLVRASSTCIASGAGSATSKAAAAISMPGVQMPHCAAPCLRKARCKSLSLPSLARPSTVVTRLPWRLPCQSCGGCLQRGLLAGCQSGARWLSCTAPPLAGCAAAAGQTAQHTAHAQHSGQPAGAPPCGG